MCQHADTALRTRAWIAAALVTLASTVPVSAQTAPVNRITATFLPAPELTFPNPADSNSPVIRIDGLVVVFNSVAGQPRRAAGESVRTAVDTNPDGVSAEFIEDIGSGRWLESVIPDADSGLLYGWYHNEIPTECPQGLRFWPRIGAAVSADGGQTWDDLGIILSPRDDTVTCDTDHPVTNGGIGDFSVILDNATDAATHYLYFIFSSYGGTLDEQGISFARMRWIDRDRPIDQYTGQSAALKWDGAGWQAPGIGGRSQAIFHDDRQVSWTSAANNGFWGPSVHWNRDLETFVVLMSRSAGGNYENGGIYLTNTSTLDDPGSWTLPKLIIQENQGWYPQVLGDARIGGTDKLAGAQARYFNRGRSDSLIVLSDSSRTAGGSIRTPPAP